MNAPTTFFDYKNQAYVIDGAIMRCGHPDSMECTCYGKLHEGEQGCTHVEVEHIQDGNIGGFNKTFRYCHGCDNALPEEY